MSLDIKHSIFNAIHDISQMNANDILVNISESKVHEMNFNIEDEKAILPQDDSILSILKKTNEFQKETGTNTLCLALGFLDWEIKSKRVHSPIFIIPVVSKSLKATRTIEINFEIQDAFLNPFLINYFASEYELTVPLFEVKLDLLNQFSLWLESVGLAFTFQKKQFIGNFHHHRYQIVKELEGLLEVNEIGENVSQILGREDKVENIIFPLVKDNLFPIDNDQLRVFEEIKKNNTVIQGPPGTGKSQVLSNLLGKILGDSSNALVVSEKRVALEVLQKKLANFYLDDFTFITTSETVAHDFILSLKKVWERMESCSFSTRNFNLHLSEQYSQNLQLQLNLLTKKDLIGGVSFDEFNILSKGIDFSKINFSSDSPSVFEWLKDKKIIEEIYNFNLNESIQFLPFEGIKSDAFNSFDSKIKEWILEIKELSKHFKVETIRDFDQAIRTAYVCQIIENELIKPYVSVLKPDSKEQKKYISLKKRQLAIKKRFLLLQGESKNWKIEPSENEAKTLKEALESNSYFTKRKAKKRIQKLISSPFINSILAISKWLEYLEINKDISKLSIEFSEIGIESPEINCEIIDRYILQLDKKEWEIYSEIEPEKRKIICEFHSKLNTLNSVFKTYFQFNLDTQIQSTIENIASQFEDLLKWKSSIVSIHKSCYRLVGKATSKDEFLKTLLKSNWVIFESNFPEFSKFKPEDIHSKIDQIILLQKEESSIFSKIIEEKIYFKFQEFHQLLRTPSQKLNSDQKLKKQKLRKGKSILVKEFSKSKSHPSIRELLKSEAAIWIHLLKPIWLSNPVQVSKCFPLEKDFFDFVIFDEASQIILANALGSLHRGKRIVVAGDNQQMSPKMYFKTGNSESIDLLHQAGYYWKNTYLKHHYRSKHPKLIEFSNKHFYQNSLIAYPSGDSIENPIHYHPCLNGVFEERINEEEAILTASILESKINDFETIGVVAFSETQLKCILDKLTPKVQGLLFEKIEQGSLFFKALEDVQGEECDHLIISMGYAKNKAGEFHMRFGPLNQKNGSKRLNVLLTRAKKSIDFVSSVKSSDFKITENESVDLLRLFILQIEQNSIELKSDPIFPFDLNPEIIKKEDHSEVHFQSLYSAISDVQELITFQRVLLGRGWKIV